MATANLNRDAILSAKDCELQPVEVPEWGGTVYIQPLSGSERAEWESYVVSMTHKGKPMPGANLREVVLVKAIRDENGERMFTDEDIPALARKHGGVIDRLFDIASKSSGLDQKDIEVAEKN